MPSCVALGAEKSVTYSYVCNEKIEDFKYHFAIINNHLHWSTSTGNDGSNSVYNKEGTSLQPPEAFTAPIFTPLNNGLTCNTNSDNQSDNGTTTSNILRQYQITNSLNEAKKKSTDPVRLVPFPHNPLNGGCHTVFLAKSVPVPKVHMNSKLGFQSDLSMTTKESNSAHTTCSEKNAKVKRESTYQLENHSTVIVGTYGTLAGNKRIKCCIPSCVTNSGGCGWFYPFPKSEAEFRRWESFMKSILHCKSAKQNSYLCGKHFKNDDVVKVEGERMGLRPGSCPSIYPSHIQLLSHIELGEFYKAVTLKDTINDRLKPTLKEVKIRLGRIKALDRLSSVGSKLDIFVEEKKADEKRSSPEKDKSSVFVVTAREAYKRKLRNHGTRQSPLYFNFELPQLETKIKKEPTVHLTKNAQFCRRKLRSILKKIKDQPILKSASCQTSQYDLNDVKDTKALLALTLGAKRDGGEHFNQEVIPLKIIKMEPKDVDCI